MLSALGLRIRFGCLLGKKNSPKNKAAAAALPGLLSALLFANWT